MGCIFSSDGGVLATELEEEFIPKELDLTVNQQNSSSATTCSNLTSTSTTTTSTCELENPPPLASSFGSNSLLASAEVQCIDELGKGSLGIVYKGTYRSTIVAIKKIKIKIPQLANGRKDIENSLQIGANRIGSLRHPNTLLFMGACLQGSSICIVSEHCTRGSLFDVIHGTKSPDSRDNDISWGLRVRLGLGAARGLLYLHSAETPLVHGQLKSTNILVDDSWNAKLADYSTYYLTEVVNVADFTENTNIATSLSRWTAPELLRRSRRNRKAKNTEEDIYGLGMVLWEITTNEIPYGDMKTDNDIRREVVIKKMRPVLTDDMGTEEWRSLIRRCWEENPKNRPSAAEIVSELETISRSKGMERSPMKKKKSSRSGKKKSRSKTKKLNTLSKETIESPASKPLSVPYEFHSDDQYVEL